MIRKLQITAKFEDTENLEEIRAKICEAISKNLTDKTIKSGMGTIIYIQDEKIEARIEIEKVSIH